MDAQSSPTSTMESNKKGMILPFQPLTMTFHNVNYFVDMPKVDSKTLPSKFLHYAYGINVT